jgi:F0F1-type ATP synthase gamma subunit
MAISDLRAGLAANLSTIKGLRVVETLPDLVNPPMAMIAIDKVAYNQQNARSMSEYTFKVLVVLGRVSERVAQTTMDVLLAPGAGSIKYAVESDRTLGGFAYEVFVAETSAIGAMSANGIDYYSAEFSVQVFAS